MCPAMNRSLEVETSRIKTRLDPWFAAALVAVLLHVVASLVLSKVAVLIFGAFVAFFLLVIAGIITTQNAIKSKQAIRLFWSFLAAAYWLWALPPSVWFYYAVLHRTSPNFLLMTFLWFLHIILIIAAMTARPHMKIPSQRPYGVTLNFLVVLFLLVFAYAYLLFPYGHVSPFSVVMRRWASMYSGENLILLIVLGTLFVRSQPPWRVIYGNLLGASTLYALESEFAHLVFASNGRFTDGLAVVPFTASMAWFIWVSLQGRKQAVELAQSAQLDTSNRRRASLLAMLAVVSIPFVGLFELLRPHELPSVRQTRMIVVLISVVLLALVAFIKDYLSSRQLASAITIANDQLRLAVESGRSAVWQWDISSGQNYWFGDLSTIFGIHSATHVEETDHFLRFVHPEDREQVSASINQAMQTRAPYSGEFRTICPDGTVHHVAATGKGYYLQNGQPERMLGVTIDITERKEAELKLRESEERFRLVSNTAPVLIWMSGVDKLCTYFNTPWLEFTGRSFEAEYGNGWAEGVHPDDLQICLAIYTESFDQRKPFRMEYRLRRRDGVYRWILDLGVPRFSAHGSFAGYIGSAIDVTDQKLAHESLQKVSGQLIEAQEKERRRIARELHDDVSQKLALLTIQLQQAYGSLNGAHPETKEQLNEIRKHCAGISLDVQTLSHQLHSSKLDYLGLAPAMKGFCTELAKQHKLEVDFIDENVPSNLPADVSLSLFRVAQEALHNAVKYSGAKQFEVQLRGTTEEIQLVVSDAGAGFNMDEGKKGGGLGLVSMQERINLVKGRFHIESKPGQGTIIIASVPLNRENGMPADALSDQHANFEGAA